MRNIAAIGLSILVAFTAPVYARGTSSGTSSSSSHTSTGEHYTKPYVRSDGTNVTGYHATNPNPTRNDNYSTRGNVNPYTGVEGTKPRDGEPIAH